MGEGKVWAGGSLGRGDGIGIYFVPFALTFGHYDLAGIQLTALVCLYEPPHKEHIIPRKFPIMQYVI